MKKLLSILMAVVLTMVSLMTMPLSTFAIKTNLSVTDITPSAYFKRNGYDWINPIMKWGSDVTYCIGLYTETIPRNHEMNEIGEIKDEKLAKML